MRSDSYTCDICGVAFDKAAQTKSIRICLESIWKNDICDDCYDAIKAKIEELE